MAQRVYLRFNFLFSLVIIRSFNARFS